MVRIATDRDAADIAFVTTLSGRFLAVHCGREAVDARRWRRATFRVDHEQLFALD
jgi:hypothetical protein